MILTTCTSMCPWGQSPAGGPGSICDSWCHTHHTEWGGSHRGGGHSPHTRCSPSTASLSPGWPATPWHWHSMGGSTGHTGYTQWVDLLPRGQGCHSSRTCPVGGCNGPTWHKSQWWLCGHHPYCSGLWRTPVGQAIGPSYRRIPVNNMRSLMVLTKITKKYKYSMLLSKKWTINS